MLPIFGFLARVCGPFFRLRVGLTALQSAGCEGAPVSTAAHIQCTVIAPLMPIASPLVYHRTERVH